MSEAELHHPDEGTDHRPGDDRAALPARLVRDRLVVTLPDRPVGSLVAAVEVMVQEGLTCFSFPATQLAQARSVAGIFGPRAELAVHDLDRATDLAELDGTGIRLAALREEDDELATALAERGIAVALPALTPTEVRNAWRRGVSAVVVVPAEVMGASYSELLAPLVPGVMLMARGGLGAYAARRWAEAGAVALWLDEALLGDALTGGSLGGLRERCQTFRQSVDTLTD